MCNPLQLATEVYNFQPPTPGDYREKLPLQSLIHNNPHIPSPSPIKPESQKSK